MMVYINIDKFNVSLHKLARIAGVSYATVQYWITRGLPYDDVGGYVCLVNLRTAVDWLEKHGYKREYISRIYEEIKRRECNG